MISRGDQRFARSAVAPVTREIGRLTASRRTSKLDGSPAQTLSHCSLVVGADVRRSALQVDDVKTGICGPGMIEGGSQKFQNDGKICASMGVPGSWLGAGAW